MSSDIVHSIDINQSECEGVQNWFKVCKFNATKVEIIDCELHAL